MNQFLHQYPLFANMRKTEAETLEQLSENICLSEGEILIQEGDIGFDFYILVNGEMSIFKKADNGELHTLGKKKAGDMIGELGFLESGLRSTSIQALTPCELIKIDGAKIRAEEQYQDLFSLLKVRMGQSISKDLRYTNEVTLKAMQSELASARLLVAAGRFMATIVFLASMYIFSLSTILMFKKYFSSTTPISIGLIIFFAVACLFAILSSGLPLANYGLTLRRWKQVAVEAVLFTLPLMGFVLIVKWLCILWISSYSQNALLQPFSMMHTMGTQMMGLPGSGFLIVALAYALFCPVQEFIARGVLQGSFQMFLQSGASSKWVAILLGNLLFSATHVHTTFVFAMLAFIPGLFWGWLFYRQRSLIGVSISHIMIGIWAIFIVGFPNLI